ncbi:hypothetical protein JKP88DRAFT_279904 [Tribonema minus]|uniref:Uncharacterized protein n=1 Tax=Tribonema minus TaxID=303371 RepID=A0A836CC71_9STRA|nr:hypothetical protein JKP88DRAFT_279904 [Tribonema minus]
MEEDVGEDPEMPFGGGARPKALKGIALARLRSALSAALHMAYSGRVMTHMAESRGGGHMEEDVGEDPEMPFGGATVSEEVVWDGDLSQDWDGDPELLRRLPPWYSPNYRISDNFDARLPFTEEEINHLMTVSGGASSVPAKWQRRWAETNQTMNLLYWWRAQGSAYLLRFNARTARELALRRLRAAASGAVPLPLPPGTAAVHVRHGDKFKEMALMSWRDHLAAVEAAAERERWPERRLYVSTDDAAVAAEVAAPGGVPGWTVHVLPCPEPRKRLPERVPCRTEANSDNPGTARIDGVSYAADLTLVSLEDLLIALEAMHFAGQRGSNWTRLIDRLRLVLAGDPVGCCTPYIDVGLSLPEDLGGLPGQNKTVGAPVL